MGKKDVAGANPCSDSSDLWGRVRSWGARGEVTKEDLLLVIKIKICWTFLVQLHANTPWCNLAQLNLCTKLLHLRSSVCATAAEASTLRT